MKGYSLHKFKVIGVLIAVVSLAGCVDEIALEGTGGGGGQLVIQGQLVKSCPSSVRVRISRTADFAIRSFPTAVQGAEVLLKDQQGNQITVMEIEPGIYQTEITDDDPDLSVAVGKNYQISITTSEGNVYESSFEELYEVPIADSISTGVVTRSVLNIQGESETKQFMQFFVHTPLSPGAQEPPSRLRWTFNHVYRIDETPTEGPGPGPQTCYVSNGLNLGQVVVFNGNASSSNRLNGFLLVEDEIDFRYGLGYLLQVRQHSLGLQAFEYWDKVSEAVALSGGLFEATPGEIPGNIHRLDDDSEVVLGYFYVSEEQLITRFITPDQAGRPTAFCSLSLFRTEDLCFNCVSIENSTKQAPDGWEQ